VGVRDRGLCLRVRVAWVARVVHGLCARIHRKFGLDVTRVHLKLPPSPLLQGLGFKVWGLGFGV